GERLRLTEQSVSVLLLELREDVRCVLPIFHAAFKDFALAGATGAVAAAVRQRDAVAHRRLQDALPGFRAENPVAWLDGDPKGHPSCARGCRADLEFTYNR